MRNHFGKSEESKGNIQLSEQLQLSKKANFTDEENNLIVDEVKFSSEQVQFTCEQVKF